MKNKNPKPTLYTTDRNGECRNIIMDNCHGSARLKASNEPSPFFTRPDKEFS